MSLFLTDLAEIGVLKDHICFCEENFKWHLKAFASELFICNYTTHALHILTL